MLPSAFPERILVELFARDLDKMIMHAAAENQSDINAKYFYCWTRYGLFT